MAVKPPRKVVSDAGEEPVSAPSFSEEVDKSRGDRAIDPAHDLADKVGAGKTSNDVEKPADEKFDFDAWDKTVPDEARNEYNRRAYDAYNSQLGEAYGDVLPFVAQIKDNPELRGLLKEASEDPELLKFMGSLSKKELRDFVRESAIPVYERTFTDAPGDPPARATRTDDDRVAKLEAKINERDTQDRNERYAAGREREFKALMNEAGDDLKWTSEKDPGYRLASHLIKIAEDRTERYAAAGRNQVVTYKEVYDEYKATQAGRGDPPPAAPATTTASATSGPQAPRSAAEGKQMALDRAKRAGGFRNLAVTASGSRRGR